MADATVLVKDLIEVRRSPVHGLGIFALQAISKGTRIIEYVGDRVSHKEADRRYEDKDEDDSHTFLFIVDAKTVIDAGVGGNDARYFNHACNPNCESVIEAKRVYIEATRNISPGEEMTYDYQIQREKDDPANIDEVFACRCGAPKCRGTMLWPTQRPAAHKKKKKKAKAEVRSSSRSKPKAEARSKRGQGRAKVKSQGRAKSQAQGKGKGKSQVKGKSKGKAQGKTQGKAKASAGASAAGGARAKAKSGRTAPAGKKGTRRR